MHETFLGMPHPPAKPIEFIPEEAAPTEPIQEFVVTVNSRCDLDCPECPVYHLEDTRWSDQPLSPSSDVVTATGRAINEHAAAHDLPAARVVLFGGEPCARGVKPIREMVETLRANTPDVELNFGMTTNGVRLGKDSELRAYLGGMGCSVAISLDGHRELNDKYRLHHNASGKKDTRGSYDEIATAIQRWNEENPDNRAGILVTLHDGTSEQDLLRTYDTVMAFQPRAVDFLLNHKKIGRQEPVRDFYDITRETDTSYGDMFITLYDHHRHIPQEQRRPVRTLDAIVDLLEGRGTASAVIGVSRMGSLAVSASGEIELDLSFGGAFDGANGTGIFVHEQQAFDRALRHPLVAVNQMGSMAGLSETCQRCPIGDFCGGGLPATRYWPYPSGNPRLSELAQLFDWPSAFCADLGKFILHVMRDQTVQISEPLRDIIAAMPTWPPAESARKLSFKLAQS